MAIDPTSLTVDEGQSNTYTVELKSQPSGDVTIAISGHSESDVTLPGAGLSADHKLTFTTSNWSEAQTVAVTAAEDDSADQDADVTLVHAISSADDAGCEALEVGPERLVWEVGLGQ